MAPRKNPLKLNTLQLKTLTVLQQFAKTPPYGRVDEASGAAMVGGFPAPHGNHFHVGDAILLTKDTTGLRNASVLSALERKGLARTVDGGGILLSPEGMAYETGLEEQILHKSDH